MVLKSTYSSVWDLGAGGGVSRRAVDAAQAAPRGGQHIVGADGRPMNGPPPFGQNAQCP